MISTNLESIIIDQLINHEIPTEVGPVEISWNLKLKREYEKEVLLTYNAFVIN